MPSDKIAAMCLECTGMTQKGCKGMLDMNVMAGKRPCPSYKLDTTDLVETKPENDVKVQPAVKTEPPVELVKSPKKKGKKGKKVKAEPKNYLADFPIEIEPSPITTTPPAPVVEVVELGPSGPVIEVRELETPPKPETTSPEKKREKTGGKKPVNQKHDDFVRLSEARLKNALKAMSLLENLGNTYAYDFTPDEAQAVVDALVNATGKVRKKLGRC